MIPQNLVKLAQKRQSGQVTPCPVRISPDAYRGQVTSDTSQGFFAAFSGRRAQAGLCPPTDSRHLCVRGLPPSFKYEASVPRRKREEDFLLLILVRVHSSVA